MSPRRISASLRGRNRHITLMLHSAGSAISAGRREGARGGVGGRDSARPGRRPRTAPPAARPPPAASDEASQQVMANSAEGQLRSLRDRLAGQSISLRPRGLQTYLPWSCPGPALRPRPTCPRPRGRRTRRCAGSEPRPAQTSRAPARSAILHQHQRAPPPARPAPLPLCPALPWSSPGDNVTSELRPDS